MSRKCPLGCVRPLELTPLTVRRHEMLQPIPFDCRGFISRTACLSSIVLPSMSLFIQYDPTNPSLRIHLYESISYESISIHVFFEQTFDGLCQVQAGDVAYYI